MKVNIDQNSGYCFGVEYAIQMAEDEVEEAGQLYCLGDIVHNDMEVRRLQDKGLVVINREDLHNLNNCKVLIRAHGEPPETYKIALENNIILIDASCPVVLKLQNRVKHAYDNMMDQDGQVVIYGKEGHAEVIGLTGQTREEAVIISTEEDLDKIDFTRPITLFSQTTKSTKGFYEIKKKIEDKIRNDNREPEKFLFEAHDSICRQVSNREPNMERFSSEHDVIIFVSGKKSSNGKALFTICLKTNPHSYFVESEDELDPGWFKNEDSVGICGATSTPMWLMEKIARKIRSYSK
ncbi:4-hydroxy-3-methylbut-2-enyl diphosphate reductase [Bacteroidota bacterium]